MMVARDKR